MSTIFPKTFADLGERLADADADTPLVLDVREPGEWQSGHLAAATSMPMNTVPDRLHEIPAGEVWVHCARGMRAEKVCRFLEQAREDLEIHWLNEEFPSAGLARSLNLDMA